MEQLEFKFGKQDFNNMFPFYILVDANLILKDFGTGLAKICPCFAINTSFKEHFIIDRPRDFNISFDSLKNHNNQLIILKCIKSGVILRGQLQKMGEMLVFIGSPWFLSMQEVLDKNLTAGDFAIQDPSLDLLHVLNNQENISQELKELLVTINDQKNKLKKDKAELNRLSLVASTNQNGVIFTEPDGAIFWCNDAYLELTGYQRNEVLGKNPIDIGLCAETNKTDLKKMTVPFFKGESFEVEFAHGKKDGNYFWSKSKGQPILDKNGKVIQYFAVIEDISNEKVFKTKLIESENRLASLILNLETAVLLEDENRKILLVNEKFCSMFGFNIPPKDLIGLDCTNSANDVKHLFKNEDLFVSRIDTLLENKKNVYSEEIELKDGRVFLRGFIPIYKENKYNGHLWTYDDVTFKKRYDESLEAEKEKYRSIIANMNLGLMEVDKNEVITLVNQSFCDISGYNKEELIGQNTSFLLFEEKDNLILEEKLKLRTEGKTDSYEIEVKNKQGKKRNWLVSGAPNFNSEGKNIGSIGIHLDITEQKQQEEQLYLLSLIAEKNTNAVIISDTKGHIEWVNTAFLEMSGYRLNEVIGKKPGNLLQGPETNKDTIEYMRSFVNQGLSFSCEIINYSKAGEKYWVSIHAQALYDKDGKVSKFFAIEENITQKKIFEQQRENLMESLAKSNEELEDYAQIVSHDLKSPLRSIHSLISWIKEDNDKEFNPQTTQYLSLIESKVEKMDHLIEGILTYSKIDKIKTTLEKVNINEIIKNIIGIIHIPSHITVDIKNKLPVLKGDRFRIQQLFQNIISNAVNYNDKTAGLVEIGCVENTTHYTFYIKDNGPGIPKENYLKIFKIFQSFTKSEKSTGIGLSIVKKIIDSYNGEIWVESEINQGATFFIKLPK
jgi:PAS domain S-box-containing protein